VGDPTPLRLKDLADGGGTRVKNHKNLVRLTAHIEKTRKSTDTLTGIRNNATSFQPTKKTREKRKGEPQEISKLTPTKRETQFCHPMRKEGKDYGNLATLESVKRDHGGINKTIERREKGGSMFLTQSFTKGQRPHRPRAKKNGSHHAGAKKNTVGVKLLLLKTCT